MKTTFHRSVSPALLVIALALGLTVVTTWAAAPAPAGAKPAATNAPVVIPKAIFEANVKDNPAFKDYRDPFFPSSERVHPKPPPPPKPVVAQDPGAPPPPPPKPKDKSSFLAVTAVSKRFAVITAGGVNFEFGVGEKDVIPTPSGDAKVKCLEIRKNSVMIQVEGEPMPVELKLPRDI